MKNSSTFCANFLWVVRFSPTCRRQGFSARRYWIQIFHSIFCEFLHLFQNSFLFMFGVLLLLFVSCSVCSCSFQVARFYIGSMVHKHANAVWLLLPFLHFTHRLLQVLFLECLHSKGYVFRNIKPESLLIDSDGWWLPSFIHMFPQC